MKSKILLFAGGIIASGLTTVACQPTTASAPQLALQEPTPPPARPAYAVAPTAPPDDGPPPPPPRRGRRPGPPPPACGPDAPPPTAVAYAQRPATTIRGSIRQFNYGREGEVSGFLLSNGTLVNFPPETGEQIAAVTKSKSEVTIVGYQRQGITGKPILDAITINADGQTIAVSAGPGGPRNVPPPPPPPEDGAAPGPPQN